MGKLKAMITCPFRHWLNCWRGKRAIHEMMSGGNWPTPFGFRLLEEEFYRGCNQGFILGLLAGLLVGALTVALIP